MTSTLPEVLEKLEPCPFCGSAAKLWTPDVGDGPPAAMCTNTDCDASVYFITPEHWNRRVQAPALLRDAGDSARLDYIERTFRGMSNGERYLPLVMGWGKSRNGRTLREAIDKYIEKEGPLTGVTFVERDMPPGVFAELRTPNDRVTIVDDDAAMHAPGGAGGGGG